MILRLVTPADHPAVISLINADQLPGQPVVTQDMLTEALTGQSPVDSAWWSELTGLTTMVAVNKADEIAGVVSYACRHEDTGVVLWLHAREDAAVTAALVDHVLARLADCHMVTAFEFASALTVGLEALPVRHRPVTHAVLLERSFVGTDLWRYMRRRLPVPELPRVARPTVLEKDGRYQVNAMDGAVMLGEAAVEVLAGIGVLWWLHVEPAARSRGLGIGLLGSAMDVLAGLGATEVILYVDDDEPGGDRDRTAANHLYDRAGFVEVDRLWSYRRDRGA